MKLRLRPRWIICVGVILSIILSGIAYGALGDYVLGRGSRGTDVQQLQKKLLQLGYQVGSADGIFGPKTETGVRNFQKDHGLKVDGLAGTKTVAELNRLTGQSTTASGTALGLKSSDITLLAHVVYAEARGEPYLGQVAVAAVVLNRKADPAFPKTIADIIYQPGAFSSVNDGQINLTPSATAIKAAQEAAGGSDPSKGALFFFNPAKTTNAYIWSRPQLIQIGNHIFTK